MKKQEIPSTNTKKMFITKRQGVPPSRSRPSHPFPNPQSHHLLPSALNSGTSTAPRFGTPSPNRRSTNPSSSRATISHSASARPAYRDPPFTPGTSSAAPSTVSSRNVCAAPGSRGTPRTLSRPKMRRSEAFCSCPPCHSREKRKEKAR